MQTYCLNNQQNKIMFNAQKKTNSGDLQVQNTQQVKHKQVKQRNIDGKFGCCQRAFRSANQICQFFLVSKLVSIISKRAQWSTKAEYETQEERDWKACW